MQRKEPVVPPLPVVKTKKIGNYIFYASLIIIGIAMGIGIPFAFFAKPKKLTLLSESTLKPNRQGGFKLCNPLLDYEIALDSKSPLRTRIMHYISEKVTAKDITSASVYFQHLDKGYWFGINEREAFSPASLLKVPLMLAYYREAQCSPAILERRVFFEKPTSISVVNIRTGKFIEPGKSYTINELITHMIVESDNEALNLLLANISPEDLNQIYLDLGIDIPGLSSNEDFMNVKDYSLFFRILYNSTYLTREMSERALELLSQAHFDQGIISGLPDGITVAHKFGERGWQGMHQLHECAIVYYPGQHYILAIMIRGESVPKMQEVLRDISKIVYMHIDQGSEKEEPAKE